MPNSLRLTTNIFIDFQDIIMRPSQGFWGAGEKAYLISFQGARRNSNYFKGTREQALNFRELGGGGRGHCQKCIWFGFWEAYFQS